MIPIQQTARRVEMEPTRVGSPPHNHLDKFRRIMQVLSCQDEVKCERPRKYRLVPSRPHCALAAPVHTDFLSQVGHAYKRRALKGPAQAFQRTLGTSPRRTRGGFEGFGAIPPEHGKTIRCQVLRSGWKNKNKGNGPLVDR